MSHRSMSASPFNKLFQFQDTEPLERLHMQPYKTPRARGYSQHQGHSQNDSGYWSLPSPESSSPEPVSHNEASYDIDDCFNSAFGSSGINIFLPSYSPKALGNSTPVINRATWNELPLSPVATPTAPRRSFQPISALQPLKAQHAPYHNRAFEPSFAAMAKNNPSPSNLDLMRHAYQTQLNVPCPPHLNTVVWVTNLPPQSTIGDVLGQVRCGKVVAVHINPPTEGILTAACKIQFFTRRGALRFLQTASSAGVVVCGQRIIVRENRNMRPPHRVVHQSRAVEIRGPPQLMTSAWLLAKFERFFEFQMEGVRELGRDRYGRVVQVWYFGSLRAQAESAVMLIERDPEMAAFEARFTEDPCAAGRFYD